MNTRFITKDGNGQSSIEVDIRSVRKRNEPVPLAGWLQGGGSCVKVISPAFDLKKAVGRVRKRLTCGTTSTTIYGDEASIRWEKLRARDAQSAFESSLGMRSICTNEVTAAK